MNESFKAPDTTELHDVFYYAPFGVLVEDCEGSVIWVNHTLQWQLGVEEREVVGKPSRELPLKPLPGARGKRLFATPGVDHRSNVARLKCIEDVLPEYSETGIRVRYFLETSEHVSVPAYQYDLVHLLDKRPPVDRLTGLQDRDAIVVTLRAEVSRSRRYGNPLSIMVLRICGAGHGGTVADHPCRTMSAASTLLRDSTRWADSIGRFSDYEFLLVLPETTAAAASKLSRKIGARIVEHNASPDSVAFKARFGVVEWARGDDECMLLRRGLLALSDNVTA